MSPTITRPTSWRRTPRGSSAARRVPCWPCSLPRRRMPPPSLPPSTRPGSTTSPSGGLRPSTSRIAPTSPHTCRLSTPSAPDGPKTWRSAAQPVPVAPGGGSSGRATARRSGGHRAAGRRARDLHLRQRAPVGRASMAQEGGPLRGGDPGAADRAGRRDRSASARTDDHLVANIDLAPTIAAAAGVELPDADGRSLLPLLEGRPETWRHALLIEHMRGTNPIPTYCALRTPRHLFVVLRDGGAGAVRPPGRSVPVAEPHGHRGGDRGTTGHHAAQPLRPTAARVPDPDDRGRNAPGDRSGGGLRRCGPAVPHAVARASTGSMSDRWPRSPVPSARRARRSMRTPRAIGASSAQARGASCGAPSAASGTTPGRARAPGPAPTAAPRTGGTAAVSRAWVLPLPLLIVGAIVGIGIAVYLPHASLGADDAAPDADADALVAVTGRRSREQGLPGPRRRPGPPGRRPGRAVDALTDGRRRPAARPDEHGSRRPWSTTSSRRSRPTSEVAEGGGDTQAATNAAPGRPRRRGLVLSLALDARECQ